MAYRSARVRCVYCIYIHDGTKYIYLVHNRVNRIFYTLKLVYGEQRNAGLEYIPDDNLLFCAVCVAAAYNRSARRNQKNILVVFGGRRTFYLLRLHTFAVRVPLP